MQNFEDFHKEFKDSLLSQFSKNNSTSIAYQASLEEAKKKSEYRPGRGTPETLLVDV